jgi:mannose-6-phosphate isomerase
VGPRGLVRRHAALRVGKLLHVNADERLSVQYHEHKDETSYVLSGVVEVTSAGETMTLEPGDAWRVEPGIVHTLAAVSDAVVVEVSTPHLDDVVRVSDVYGRA